MTILQPLDALKFLLPVAVLLALGGLVVGYSAEGAGMLFLCAAVVVAFYIRELFARKAEIARYDLVLDCGIYISRNGYKGARVDFEKEIEKLVPIYKRAGYDVVSILRRGPVKVEFVPGVFTADQFPGKKLAGLTTQSSTQVAYFEKVGEVFVAWPECPVEITAFSHEIEHTILYRVLGFIDNTTHHKKMQEMRDLPAKP